MALPTVTKTWINSNPRLSYVSLNGVMSQYLFQIKAFLKTNGYAVKGSCDGTTGAMDGVDRWASAANCTTRGTAAGTSQSWIVLVDANGNNILLAYQGATDDVARLSFSPGGLMIAAGTPAQQPTATDEQVLFSATSIINATTSNDRMLFCWVSSDKKSCRFAIARAGVWVGVTWGVEDVQSTVANGPIFTPNTWGFAFLPGSLNATFYASPGYSVNTRGGYARIVVGGTPFNCQCFPGFETYATVATTWGNIKTPLQGAVGYPMFPIGIGTSTTNAEGKVGNLTDWWFGRTTATDGDVYGSLQFLVVGSSGGVVWPWDGVTTPVLL